jgi:hypothetical protein
MGYFILGLILSVVLVIVLAIYGHQECDIIHNMADGAAVILGVITAIALIVFLCVIPFWIGAGVKAEIVNRTYNTSYTQKEIFFASDVIEEVREIERMRLELKGDLLKK